MTFINPFRSGPALDSAAQASFSENFHGHVFKRADGMSMRCGGRTRCQTCKREGEMKDAGQHPAQNCDSRFIAVLDSVDPDLLKAAESGDALSRVRAAKALREQLASGAAGGIDTHALRADNGGIPKQESAPVKTLTIADFPLLTSHLNDKGRAKFESSLKVLTDGAAAGEIANMRLKEAKDFLGRDAYDAWRKNISDTVTREVMDAMPEDVKEAYWGITIMGLHEFRFVPKKLAKVKSKHPVVDAMRAMATEVMPLVELVDGLKDKVIKRVPKTEEQKKEEAIEKAIPRTPFSQAVWDAVMSKKPELEASYQRQIRSLFESMVKALGAEWEKAVSLRFDTYAVRYTDKALEKMKEMGLSSGTIGHWKGILKNTLGQYITDGSLNDQKLEAGAKEYADAVCLAIVTKIQDKAGELENPTVDGHLAGFEFRLRGEHKGSKVVIEQGTKLVVNSYGTMYNQWPALIYRDGKFMPEAAYKAWMVGKE